MTTPTRIALLPGDGIGPEVLEGPVRLLERLSGTLPLELVGPLPYGTTGWLATGEVLPAQTVQAVRDCDVILSGAVGTHPGVDRSDCPHPEAALIRLRHLFDLRVNVRTVWTPQDGEVVVVRNITGGAYADEDMRRESGSDDEPAEDVVRLWPARVREVLTLAFDHAAARGGELMSVDKASVFATSRLWRTLATEIADGRSAAVRHVNVDRAAYELADGRSLPGVLVTEGIFGDILSDILCARAGSPAMCGSATVNPDRPGNAGVTGLFEPAHGSSPHRTGSGRANPVGAWLALADLLDWCPSLAESGVAAQVRQAVRAALAAPGATYDLRAEGEAELTTDQFNDRVLALVATA